ncbi:MAG: M10 family metallopeptidase C-terminal domain-containing protein, partial [Planctomyces sp.]
VLFFSSDGDGSGRELWRVNSGGIAEIVSAPGSTTGINAGTASSHPGLILGVGGAVYFVADDGTSGRELWKTTTTDVIQGTPQSDLITITYTPAGWQVTMKTGNAPIVNLALFPLTSPLNVLASGGVDTIRIVGTSGGDRFSVDGSGLTLNNARISLFEHENVSLAGLQASDLYSFDADMLSGAFLVDDLSGASDTIDFSSTDSVGVTVSLGTTAEQLVSGAFRLRLSSFSSIENLVGGSRNDRLTGNSSNNILNGNGGSDTMNGFTGDDTMSGGSGDDFYLFSAVNLSSPIERDFVTELPSGGIDTLNFSGLLSGINLNLNTTAFQAVHDGRILLLSSFATFENALGGSGSDRLTGNALQNQLNGNGGNDTINGYFGDDTLLGGPGDDSFVFGTTSGQESDYIVEAANAGIDTVSFASITTAVTMNLNSSAVQSVHQDRLLRLNSFSVIENVIGGTNDDILTGNALNNVLSGGTGRDRLNAWTGDDTMAGGPGDDTYIFGPPVTTENDRIIELPGGGNDSLNFTAITTDVRLSLDTTLPQEVHFGRILSLSSGIDFENAETGSGNDTLRGNSARNRLTSGAGDDVLVGGSGNDTLNGGIGRDVIAAGSGADIVSAGAQEDLIIAGQIVYQGIAENSTFIAALQVLWLQPVAVSVRSTIIISLVNTTATVLNDGLIDEVTSSGDASID